MVGKVFQNNSDLLDKIKEYTKELVEKNEIGYSHKILKKVTQCNPLVRLIILMLYKNLNMGELKESSLLMNIKEPMEYR